MSSLPTNPTKHVRGLNDSHAYLLGIKRRVPFGKRSDWRPTNGSGCCLKQSSVRFALRGQRRHWKPPPWLARRPQIVSTSLPAFHVACGRAIANGFKTVRRGAR